MLMNIEPLIKNRNYRLLYLGQFISGLGSMITYVALPYQIFQMTKSSLAVGMMGVVELAPLLITALLGGVYADTLDRKRLLIISEAGLSVGCLMLVMNSMLPHPSLIWVYCTAALMSAINGFHRPALDSLTPRLVKKEEVHSIGSLGTIKHLIGTICGPAVGGILIASFGVGFTYAIDFITFGFSIFCIIKLNIPPTTQPQKNKNEKSSSPLSGIQEGFKYAWSRPELIGSYLVDFVAMVFGMPMALFPALSESMGGPKAVGLFYSAPSLGAMIATLFSGWTKNVNRHGAAISVSALFWGIGITAFGFSYHLWVAVFFLMVAGAADAMSAVFRMSLWNQTIPDKLRGRLAGLEMISYMSGPLLGNAESGLVAAAFDTRVSVISGGVLCLAGVFVSVLFLPGFWRYKMNRSVETQTLLTH